MAKGQSHAQLNVQDKVRKSWENLQVTRTEKTMTEWVDQQQSSGFIITRPTIQLQALKWAEKYCELSVDFKATRGCVLGLCRDIILYFEEFDGF